MKDLIFVTCLYFQILLVQCDIFVNNANVSEAKMCIQKSINHLFPQNDTLNLVLNNDLCEDAIFEMNTMRPYIVLNMDVINGVNKLQYDGQFIICPKDVHCLNRTLYSAYLMGIRNMRGMGNSKILVITNITYTSWMFGTFWDYGINNVIILVYGQGPSKLLTCNPFAPENACGKTIKLRVVRQDCEQQLSLSFTSVIEQVNKCPVTFLFLSTDLYLIEGDPTTRAMQYNIIELSHHLNATFQRTIINNKGQTQHRLSRKVGMIEMMVGTDDNLGKNDLTEPLLRSDVLWLVPKAGQLSNMNVCLKVFNYDVWIATSIVFICVWLTWFLIISRNGGFTFNNLCLSFLNVWSLTIFGNVVSPLSRSLALHILLLFSLFYAINMQFAFTSDMSTVLTAPRYGFQIRNLKQLIDSELPIYTYDVCKKNLFKTNDTDRKLYTKLKNSVHGVTLNEYAIRLVNLHLHGNYAVITYRQDMRQAEIRLNNKVEAYEIRDSSITPAWKHRLCLLIDNYFTTTLNTFVGKMIESGIYEKQKNDFYRKFYAEKVDTTPQDDFITLKHLTFIFVIFGFGLCTACVVFCFEVVLHKYL